MTKQELEKMFEEKQKTIDNITEMFISGSEQINPRTTEKYYPRYYDSTKQLKDFVFETIIPEVIKRVCSNFSGYDDCSAIYLIEKIKQKAKDLYGIDL